ncbi:hypothetical protein [Microbacterium rhizomatis]|uniref:ABC transporter permease n=1 Tax=Microbacterium rhizomatis TaxID=1631477 RepID=A0A5J5J5L8_9MICO|nr:hypothetical protein [Microbacterium rhizomatis]KAA9110719.1 hypothetical protein F6B43_03485 [Microbacterium rhizomatis]
MTTTTATRTRGRAFADAVRTEASKLWSLPATWLLLGGTLALTIVLSIAFGTSANLGPGQTVNILDYGVTAVTWTQCGFFLLGVIASTSEYIGGQIRTTLVAIPDRIAWRLAATVALVPFAFVAGFLVVGASITTILLTTGASVTEADLGLAARIITSAAGYLTLMAVLSSALGFLIRRAIPAAAILLVYLLILSPLLQSQNWYFLPDIASYTLWFASIPDTAPPALVSWLVLLAWTLAFLIPSISIANRRDT